MATKAETAKVICAEKRMFEKCGYGLDRICELTLVDNNAVYLWHTKSGSTACKAMVESGEYEISYHTANEVTIYNKTIKRISYVKVIEKG